MKDGVNPWLVEGHADPLVLSPDDVTGDVRVVRLEDEIQTIGDIARVTNFDRRPEIDMSLIKQLTVLPANSIAPDIDTFLRGFARLSRILVCIENFKIDEGIGCQRWLRDLPPL
jgi:hypothetical protein